MTFKKLILTNCATLSILACSNSPHSENTNIVAGDTHLYAYTVNVKVPALMGLKEKTELGYCVLKRHDDSEAELLTEKGSLDTKQIAGILGTGYTPSNPAIASARGESQETILAIAGAPYNSGVWGVGASGGQDQGIARVDAAIVGIRTFALMSKDIEDYEVTLSPLRVKNIIAEVKAAQPNEGHKGQCTAFQTSSENTQ